MKVVLLISNYDDEYHGHPEENIHNYINQFEKLEIEWWIIQKETNSNSFVMAKVLAESCLDHIEQDLERLD